MIRVEYERGSHRVTVLGHAGGVYGQDLVCAAATVLCYTLAANLQQLYEQGCILRPALCLRAGHAELCGAPLPGGEGRLRERMDGVCLGFALLGAQFPEQLQLTMKSDECLENAFRSGVDFAGYQARNDT